MSITKRMVLGAMTAVLTVGPLCLADGGTDRRAYRATYTLHIGAPDGQAIGTVNVDMRRGHWRGRAVLVMRSMAMTGGNVGTNLIIMDEADHSLLFKRAEGHDASIAIVIEGESGSFTRLPYEGTAEAGDVNVPGSLTDLLALEPTLAARGFPAGCEIHLVENELEPRRTTVRVSAAAAERGAPRWHAEVALERGTMTSTMTDGPPFTLERVIEAGPARIYWTLGAWEYLE